MLLGSLPPSDSSSEDQEMGGGRFVDALVLENPFPSVPTMITESLYPSRWLPYHYLTGFVLDRWDALGALKGEEGGKRSPLGETDVLFVSGEKDGLVRPELVRRMFEAAVGSESGVGGGEKGEGGGRLGGGREEKKRRVVEWLSIKERSHDDAWMAKGDWGMGVRSFLERSGALEVEKKRDKER